MVTSATVRSCREGVAEVALCVHGWKSQPSGQSLSFIGMTGQAYELPKLLEMVTKLPHLFELELFHKNGVQYSMPNCKLMSSCEITDVHVTKFAVPATAPSECLRQPAVLYMVALRFPLTLR